MSNYTIAVYDTNLPDYEIDCYRLDKKHSEDDILPYFTITEKDDIEANKVYQIYCKLYNVVAKFDDGFLCISQNKNKGE